MKRIFLIIAIVAILVGTVGGIAYAQGFDNHPANQPAGTTQNTANPVAATANNSANSNCNSANNPSKSTNQDMIKLMRDNGFKDAARYMQTGNEQAMADYMKNLSQADYEKMIQLMKDNGYEDMAQMMESLGKDGMVQMHNSMM